MKIEVIYINPGLPGYQPVFYMARLAAKCFDTELVVLPPPKSPSIAEILSSLRPLRKHGAACVLICPQPGNLVSAFMLERLREKYGHIVAWVFDSFWLKYVPRVVRLAGIFDQIFVTELEDLVSWRAMLRAPVDWLPWGADALRLGSSTAKRPLDLLRFGRQPPEWEDDIATERICDSMQLHFSGRPPYFENENDNEQTLMKKLGQTKFTLSFSNNVSPGTQTHPDRQYLTARWTDALSAGATVAGIPPKSESVKELLWEDALLDLQTVNRQEGLAIIANAALSWTPHRAIRNHLRSLEKLDWRWRFAKIANALDINSQTLDTELSALRKKITYYRRIA